MGSLCIGREVSIIAQNVEKEGKKGGEIVKNERFFKKGEKGVDKRGKGWYNNKAVLKNRERLGKGSALLEKSRALEKLKKLKKSIDKRKKA